MTQRTEIHSTVMMPMRYNGHLPGGQLITWSSHHNSNLSLDYHP